MLDPNLRLRQDNSNVLHNLLVLDMTDKLLYWIYTIGGGLDHQILNSEIQYTLLDKILRPLYFFYFSFIKAILIHVRGVML